MQLLCRMLLVISLVLLPRGVLSAETFLVTKTADSNDHTCDSDCSLREAIEAANGNPGADAITLPAGTYLITIGGPSVFLSITDGATINGEGESSTIIDGNSGAATGGLPLLTIEADVGINDLTIRNNGAGPEGNGAGILCDHGELTLTNATVSDHGGTYDDIIRGVGIRTYLGDLTLINSTVSGNHGVVPGSAPYQGRGGGIYILAGRLELIDSTVSGNSIVAEVAGIRSANGGGIWANYGPVELTNSTVSGNTASDNGGGIFSYASAVFLTNSTVSGNTAAAKGGGIMSLAYDVDPAVLWLTNSTVSGNTAAKGGGIMNEKVGGFYARVRLMNSTVAGNTASTAGGGIYNSGGEVEVENSIVANQPAGGNCDGTLTSLGYNVTDDASCGFSATGDQVVADARLGPLADNGGPTRTHALRFASPAIDAANLATCPPTDQRGVTRPQLGGCDVGSYERKSLPPAVPALPSAWRLLVASLGCAAFALLRRRRPTSYARRSHRARKPGPRFDSAGRMRSCQRSSWSSGDPP